jgi:hypothetical protein
MRIAFFALANAIPTFSTELKGYPTLVRHFGFGFWAILRL